jgi:hypothetical protein
VWETLLEAVFGTLTKEQRSFIVRSTWVGIVSFHMIWVCGWISFTGLEAPFAKAVDMSEANKHLQIIAMQLQADRIDRLDQAIQTVRGLQCRTAVDSPARQNYTDRLNELFRKYVELKGVEPHVPRCDET